MRTLANSVVNLFANFDVPESVIFRVLHFPVFVLFWSAIFRSCKFSAPCFIPDFKITLKEWTVTCNIQCSALLNSFFLEARSKCPSHSSHKLSVSL